MMEPDVLGEREFVSAFAGCNVGRVKSVARGVWLFHRGN